MLSEALGLWRGQALADFTFDSFAQLDIARLGELRLSQRRTWPTPSWPWAATPT